MSGGTVFAGDSLTSLTQAFASRNALGPSGSTLNVTGYTLTDGNSGANYSVTLQPALGTIIPAPLIVTAQGDSRQYDGTTSSGVAPASCRW